jgi:hypothetical protein
MKRWLFCTLSVSLCWCASCYQIHKVPDEPKSAEQAPPSDEADAAPKVATGPNADATSKVDAAPLSTEEQDTPPSDIITRDAGSAETRLADSSLNTERPAPAIDCLHGDSGPSSPELLREIDYEIQVCDSQGSDCVDFFRFRADCSLWLQVNDQPFDAVADGSNCAALKRWATSEFLFDGLNDDSSCLPGNGNPPELTEVELTTGFGPRKPTSLCVEEPFISLRACVAEVRKKYFPGK